MMFIQGEDFDSGRRSCHAGAAQEVWPGRALPGAIWQLSPQPRSRRLGAVRSASRLIAPCWRSSNSACRYLNAARFRRHRHRRRSSASASGMLAALHHNRWLDRLDYHHRPLHHRRFPYSSSGPCYCSCWCLHLKLIDVPYGWSGLFHIDAVLAWSPVIANGILPIIVRQTRSAMLEDQEASPSSAPPAPKACPNFGSSCVI